MRGARKNMPERLKEKIALVVGAGSIGPGWGNGKATAVVFAREGAKVFCADINLAAAKETAAIINKEGGEARAHKADVTKAAEVATMAATSAAFVTSALWARASPPSLLIMAAVSFAASRLISAQKTFAPSRANATAVALPLPQPGPMEPAPTTSAIFSFSRSGMFFLAPRIAFAQLRLQDLAVIVLRQRIDED